MDTMPSFLRKESLEIHPFYVLPEKLPIPTMKNGMDLDIQKDLKGDQIPVAGRLMALVDAYDALTSKRVYKSQISHEEAVQIILEGKGSHFDPDVVDAFMKVKENFRQIALTYTDS